MKVLELESINQSFKLKCEGVDYQMRLLWNARASAWVLDISTQDGTPVASGISLRLGANNINQLKLGIGSVVLFDAGAKNIEPAIDTLNVTAYVLQLTQAETL